MKRRSGSLWLSNKRRENFKIVRLFRSSVCNFSLYVWNLGQENLDFSWVHTTRRVHLKFSKTILNLKLIKCTPNCRAYGETYKYQTLLFIRTRMVIYWAKILTAHNNKRTSAIYLHLISVMQMNHLYTHGWNL